MSETFKKFLIILLIIASALGLPILASYLQPQPPIVNYQVIDKMEDYIQHKHSRSPTYNLLLLSPSGKRETKRVDLLTYHDAHVGAIVPLYGPRGTPWELYVVFTYLGLFLLSMFWGIAAIWATADSKS